MRSAGQPAVVTHPVKEFRARLLRQAIYTHGTAEKRGVIILMFLLVKCRAGDVSRRKEIFN